MRVIEFVIGLFVFLAFVLFGFSFAVGQEEKRKRLVGIVEGVMPTEEAGVSWVSRVDALLAKVLPSQLGTAMLEKKLREAGRPFQWDVHDVTVVRVVLAAVLFALSFVSDTSVNGHIVLGLIFAAIGLTAPNLLISSYKKMRQGKIRKQLRGFQMMLALLSGTGIRFDQALDQAIQTTTGEFREILEMMQKRLDFQATLPEAFAWLSEETGLDELVRMSVVVEQSAQNGTSISDALQTMIREYDEELDNKIERLSQSVNLKVTLTVLFLIVGPSIGFDGVIVGIDFIRTFTGF